MFSKGLFFRVVKSWDYVVKGWTGLKTWNFIVDFRQASILYQPTESAPESQVVKIDATKVIFMPRIERSRGHIVLPLSVCPSACLHKLNMKT